MSKDINKQIKDQAWDKMNILLDEHLPVKKKKSVWIIWSIMGVFLLLMTGFWANQVQRESNQETLPKNIENTIIKQEKKKNSEPMATLFDSSIPSKYETTQQVKLQQTYSSKNKDIQIKTSESTSIQYHDTKVPIMETINKGASFASTLVKDHQKLNESSSIFPSTIIEKDISRNIGSNTSNNPNEITSEITSLSSKIVSQSNNKEILRTSTKSIKSDLNFEQYSRWGLIAGFFTDNFQALNGGYFGIFRSARISKKVDLNYGLTIDAMVKSGFEDVINSSDNNQFLSINVGGEKSKAIKDMTPIERNSSYSAIANSVDQLYYANIPLHLNYWMLPRLGLNMGVNLSYLLYGTNFSSIRSNNNDFEGVDDEYLYTNRILNRLDLGVEAGLSYKLNTKFNANLTYRHGISQVLRKSQHYDRVDYNRTFDFSIEYML